MPFRTLLPLAGLPSSTSLLDVFLLGMPYTAVSLVRQFVIRRRFDARMRRGKR